MLYLKQSTASQSVLIGPFVDSTDGVTAETGLTIANTDIRLSKAGGNMAAKNSGGGTHDEEGLYTITLDATDTATVGTLQLSVQDAAHLPVYHEYTVLEEAVYDDLFAASAAGYAGITELATVDTNVDAILVDTAEIGAAGVGLTEAGGDGDHLTAINLPNQTMDITGDITGNLSGSVGSVTGAVGSVTGAVGSVTGAVGSVAGNVDGNVDGNVTGSVGSNLELGPAEVNAEVVDVMKTDTLTATPQGAPPTTPTFEEAVMVVYDALVHAVDVTATSKTFKNNAGTVIWKKALSDDGTTYTEAESVSGP